MSLPEGMGGLKAPALLLVSVTLVVMKVEPRAAPQAVHPVAMAAQMGTPHPACSNGSHHSQQIRGHTRTARTGSPLGSTLRQHHNRPCTILLRCTCSSTPQTRGGPRQGVGRWVEAEKEAAQAAAATVGAEA